MRIILIGAGMMTIARAAANDISHYRAEIEPDPAGQSVKGQVTITLTRHTPAPASLQLSAGGLLVESVREGNHDLRFSRTGGKLDIALPAHAGSSAARTITIRYRGKPASGLHFSPNGRQVFSAFATSEWLPCVDAPAARAALDLTLIVPAGLKVVANGRHLGTTTLPDGRQRSEWRETRPTPSYLYGFAIGDFREVLDDSAKPRLRYLAPPRFSEAEMRRIFRETRGMIAYYEKISGIAYPAETYTQVLVEGAAAQEMQGFAVMGENYGKRVLEDETRVWLGAHELSHQWWGNAVTNADWTHFWLNEGVASFLNAAYLEQRFGRPAYDGLIDAARAKYEKIRAAGKDKPLVFADWDMPSAEDRSLVYDKGAYVLHQLRAVLGEEKFWRGLREYTRRHWSGSVTTAQFQQSLQEATGEDLATFFAQWVYLRPRG